MYPFMVPKGFAQFPVHFKKAKNTERLPEETITEQKKPMSNKDFNVIETTPATSSTRLLLGDDESISDTASTTYDFSMFPSCENLLETEPQTCPGLSEDMAFMSAEAEDKTPKENVDSPRSSSEAVMSLSRNHTRRRSYSKNPVTFVDREIRPAVLLREGTLSRHTIFDINRLQVNPEHIGDDSARTYRHHQRRRSQSKTPLLFIPPQAPKSKIPIPIPGPSDVLVRPSHSASTGYHLEDDLLDNIRRSFSKNPLSFLKPRKAGPNTLRFGPEETDAFERTNRAVAAQTLSFEEEVDVVPQDLSKMGLASKLKKLTKKPKSYEELPEQDDEDGDSDEVAASGKKKPTSGMDILAATMGYGNGHF